jgi:hypothetical protein
VTTNNPVTALVTTNNPVTAVVTTNNPQRPPPPPPPQVVTSANFMNTSPSPPMRGQNNNNRQRPPPPPPTRAPPNRGQNNASSQKMSSLQLAAASAAAPARKVLSAVSGAADALWQDTMQLAVGSAQSEIRRRKTFKPTVEPGKDDRQALLEERQRQSREDLVNQRRGRVDNDQEMEEVPPEEVPPAATTHSGTRRIDAFFSDNQDDISSFYSDREEEQSIAMDSVFN